MFRPRCSPPAACHPPAGSFAQGAALEVEFIIIECFIAGAGAEAEASDLWEETTGWVVLLLVILLVVLIVRVLVVVLNAPSSSSPFERINLDDIRRDINLFTFVPVVHS